LVLLCVCARMCVWQSFLWDIVDYLRELKTQKFLLFPVYFESVTFCMQDGQIHQPVHRGVLAFNCIFDHFRYSNFSTLANTTVSNDISTHGVYEEGCMTSLCQSSYLDSLTQFFLVVIFFIKYSRVPKRMQNAESFALSSGVWTIDLLHLEKTNQRSTEFRELWNGKARILWSC